MMEYIHETVVRDVIDLMKDVKDSDVVQMVSRLDNGKSIKSITSKAQALTMVFPVVCSRNMVYDTACMISKAIERQAVTMLQMLFSAANITEAKDALDYISQFHTNINTGKMSVDEFMGALNDLVVESSSVVGDDYYAFRESCEKVKKDMKAMNIYFEMEDINESSISNYKVTTVGKESVVVNLNEDVTLSSNNRRHNTGTQRVDRDDRPVNVVKITPADGNPPYYTSATGSMMTVGDLKDSLTAQQLANSISSNDLEKQKHDLNISNSKHKNYIDDENLSLNRKKYNDQNKQFGAEFGYKIKKDRSDEKYRADKDEYQRDLDNKKLSLDAEKAYWANRKNAADINKLAADIAKTRLVDNDIKKANELVPTLMHINFITVDSNSSYPIYNNAIIGVKAKLYAVDSSDILNRLKVKHNDKNLLLNLIRVSTREISFFKDFLFAVDKAKIDALSQSRRGSSNKLWKVLERRAIRSKMKRMMSLKNDATAITTLCITQDEVEFLKKTEYIDVENPKVIAEIMDAYNLMAFVIADEALEICKFLFDTGEANYEILTYNNLEKEGKDNSKKILNLMSKVSR